MQQVIVVGSSGHAKVVADVFGEQGIHGIIGFIDPFRTPGELVLGRPVFGGEDRLPACLQEHPGAQVFVAIGDNWVRQAVSARILQLCPGVRFATAIHPRACVARDVIVGSGVVVMAGAVVNSGCVLGDGVIVNTRCSIDHDCRVERGASLAPGCTLGGNVVIGEASAISIGATIKNRVSIGRNTVIGAGALVLTDIGDGVLAYGVPARVVRSRRPDEPYL